MFRLTINWGYTASQERITVVSRGLPVQHFSMTQNTLALRTMQTVLNKIRQLATVHEQNSKKICLSHV